MTPNRRLLATVFLALFAGVGLWLFRGRLVHDVTLRLELPPFVTDAGGARIERHGLGRLEGRVVDAEGAEVARFEARAGEGPLAGPVALRLRDGAHVAEIGLPEVRGGLALSGRFEVSGGGEARVDVRAARR
jgi:hypothetical protein